MDRHIQRCKPCRKNMISASQYPQVVEEYLASELEAGRVVGPLDLQKCPQVQVSLFGVIPKSHQPNKWLLIVDLSSPEGKSVNDCIDKSLCSLSYVSVDDLAEIIRRVGHKALLAKLDIRSAYRIVPVHPEDRQFLGMQWKGKVVHRHSSAFWSSISSKAVQCTGGCPGMDHAEQGVAACSTLLR